MSEGRAPGRRVLACMAKAPRPGEVKTRLAPALGLEGAAELYRAFLDDLLTRLGRLPGIERRLVVWPPGCDPLPGHASAEAWPRVDQRGGGLGERMDHVFETELARGGVVVLTGTDVPTMPARRVLAAFRALERPDGPDVVLAPDAGGGYYLVGMRSHVRGLFDVRMSTRTMFEETCEKAIATGARLAIGKPWYDVDEPVDLERLEAELARPLRARIAPVTARLLRARGGPSSLPPRSEARYSQRL